MAWTLKSYHKYRSFSGVARSMKHDQKKSVPQTREISKFTALRYRTKGAEKRLYADFVDRAGNLPVVSTLRAPLVQIELTNSEIFLFVRRECLRSLVAFLVSRVTEISRTLLPKDSCTA